MKFKKFQLLWNYLDCILEKFFWNSSKFIAFPTVECFIPKEPLLVPKILSSYHLMKLSWVTCFGFGVIIGDFIYVGLIWIIQEKYFGQNSN